VTKTYTKYKKRVGGKDREGARERERIQIREGSIFTTGVTWKRKMNGERRMGTGHGRWGNGPVLQKVRGGVRGGGKKMRTNVQQPPRHGRVGNLEGTGPEKTKGLGTLNKILKYLPRRETAYKKGT